MSLSLVRVVSNFHADVRRALVSELAQDGFLLTGADTSSTEAVCRLYCNVKLRSLPSRVRAVFRARELDDRAASGVVPAARIAVANTIITKAERGEDLTAFLHRPLTNDPGFNDGLLNEWNIFPFPPRQRLAASWRSVCRAVVGAPLRVSRHRQRWALLP